MIHAVSPSNCFSGIRISRTMVHPKVWPCPWSSGISENYWWSLTENMFFWPLKGIPALLNRFSMNQGAASYSSKSDSKERQSLVRALTHVRYNIPQEFKQINYNRTPLVLINSLQKLQFWKLFRNYSLKTFLEILINTNRNFIKVISITGNRLMPINTI